MEKLLREIQAFPSYSKLTKSVSYRNTIKKVPVVMRKDAIEHIKRQHFFYSILFKDLKKRIPLIQEMKIAINQAIDKLSKRARKKEIKKKQK